MALQSVDTYTSQAEVKLLYSAYGVNARMDDIAEVQKIVRSGTPTGGTFTLTYGSSTTATIAYDASELDIQEALRGIWALRSCELFDTTGTSPDLTHRVRFVDVTGDATALTSNTGSLTGGSSPDVVISTEQAGDDDALDDAIIHACEEINKYAWQRYSATRLGESNLVNQWATWLSCYFLSGRKGNEIPTVFVREREQIQKQLEKVMANSMSLPNIPERRATAPVWSNMRADPRYNFRVLRVQKGTSSKKPQTSRQQVTDYQEVYNAEL